ncbi:MAG: hypothetical protein ACREVI_09250 [Steroidobacteraceae bacterium]
MAKDYEKTVRIRQPAKVAPDERGRNVWVGRVETVELELVSTTALEKLLKSDDGRTRSEIRKLVAGRKDGVLARDTATGHFQIVDDADLAIALDSDKPRSTAARSAEVTTEPLSEKARQAADDLSLVSTQILRKVLKPQGRQEPAKPKAGKKDKFGGFNPYDNN